MGNSVLQQQLEYDIIQKGCGDLIEMQQAMQHLLSYIKYKFSSKFK